MLKEDAKKFYRNLDTKNIEARKSISMAKVEPYWKSMLGEEAQLNDKTEWIRREETRKLWIWVS
jgi:hypothetical protein